MRTLAILNPRAGIRSHRALKAFEHGRIHWKDLEVRVTNASGEAREIARDAARRGCETVLVAGGDGTANEAAWGLLGSPTALGLIPVGSGNGLARALGISLDPRRAVALLAEASPRKMDIGRVNGRPFLNVAGAGLDAAVGAEFHRRGLAGGRRGVFSYIRLSVRMALDYQPETWKLSTDGIGFEGRAFLVAFANGRQYGGGAVLAPRACLDDGKLDVVVVEAAPFSELLLNAPRLFWKGSIERFRRYRCFHATQAVLTAPTPAEYYRDGEPEPGEQILEVRLDPQALNILVPPGAPGGLFRSD